MCTGAVGMVCKQSSLAVDSEMGEHTKKFEEKSRIYALGERNTVDEKDELLTDC